MFVALCGLQQCGIEEPGLAEKECFYLESVVSVLGHVLRVEGCGPKLEGLGVFPEAEGSRQGDEEGALPVSRCFTEPMGDAFRFCSRRSTVSAQNQDFCAKGSMFPIVSRHAG